MRIMIGRFATRLSRTCTIAGLSAVMALPAATATAQSGWIGGQAGGQYRGQVQPSLGGAVQRGIQETTRGAISGQSFGDAARQGLQAGQQTLTNPQYQQPYGQPYYGQPYQQPYGQPYYGQPYGQQYQRPYRQQYQQPYQQQYAQQQYAQPQRAWQGNTQSQSQMNADRPYAGIRLEQTDDGVRVVQIHPNSPAAQAGLREGDIIRQLRGQDLQGRNAFIDRVRQMRIGDQVALSVLRDGQPQDIQLQLGAVSQYQQSIARANQQNQANREQVYRQNLDANASGAANQAGDAQSLDNAGASGSRADGGRGAANNSGVGVGTGIEADGSTGAGINPGVGDGAATGTGVAPAGGAVGSTETPTAPGAGAGIQ